MGLFSLVLEVLMLIGLLGAAACTVLETLKPECSDLLTERCTALGHSTSMMLLVCLILGKVRISRSFLPKLTR